MDSEGEEAMMEGDEVPTDGEPDVFRLSGPSLVRLSPSSASSHSGP
jgi:hypothetical protein